MPDLGGAEAVEGPRRLLEELEHADMVGISRRGWATLSLLIALVFVGAALWAVSRAAAESDPEQPTAASDPAVPEADPEPTDGEVAEDLPMALPQPPMPDRTPNMQEDLSKFLEIEVEKPFRRIRGDARRFDVTVRVRNISEDEKPVEGPVYLYVAGSTLGELEVLRAPALSEEGRALFPVIERERSLSAQARRGRLLRIAFEIPEASGEKDGDGVDEPEGKAAADELTEEDFANAEIDFKLTRKGLDLAVPVARATVPKGRGKGLKNRALPIAADDPDMKRAQEAVAEVSGEIIRMDGVHAIGTAINENNDIVQLVMIGRLGIEKKLPKEIGGVPVETKVTWPIKPRYDVNDPHNRGQAGTAIATLPPPGACPLLPVCQNGSLQSRFDPEIPIGAQIANVTDPFVGTYGSLVQRSNVSFLLSNSHVMADANLAALGERIAQSLPGTANEIASLTAFVTIDFSLGAQNRVDAAIAQIDAGASRIPTFITPCSGYGAQSNLPVTAQVGDTVSKCGRTTDCTQGTVTSINMTANVNYAPQPVATFVNQIVIVGNTPAPFSQGGDSGSMIVNTANAQNRPTGLLFAGGLSGGVDFTFANQIDDVLSALNVQIIGVPAGCPTK